MDLTLFGNDSSGVLVPIGGTDPQGGHWEHRAFVPNPLPDRMPPLAPATFLQVASARASLAALDSTARHLPNPGLLRLPSLRREAQSTSALEGTYAPLHDVLTADASLPVDANLHEVLNYVSAAEQAFAWQADGRPLTMHLLEDLQGILVRGTPSESSDAGHVRTTQVVIGHRAGEPVSRSRFVPPPPGRELRTGLRELVDWVNTDRRERVDPVVAAAMAHYLFESLHPFNDGNGRIGRLLIVLQLYASGVLSEPTLTVSPWFEARRTEYYDLLLGVSTAGAWDPWVFFFARGLEASAAATHDQMLALVAVQAELKGRVRTSHLRADSAQLVVDYAVGHPSFTVRDVEAHLQVSYPRANKLVGDLVRIGVLAPSEDQSPYRRRFVAPAVLEVLEQS